ncbi:VWA domain-containing protein [Deinococcus hopiensis]|uniref:Stress response protein SCP2 n=1 Tax=Deinococcus hopiensis KR-140 TaxID=695939 RepID=A0A1W1UPB1_9DEIO|nr:VWA domain-containing protein [Deinococcus hopiensis]SMB82965.1 Stress response protein SCP2 [Deinococcus hopiensis KR-140]
MTSITTGQRLPLCQQNQGTVLTLTAHVDHADVDISLFALDADRKMKDDAYLTFFNQPLSPGNEIRMTQEGGSVTFQVDLDRLPDWIARLVLSATSDSQPIGRMTRGDVHLSVPGQGEFTQSLTPGGQELALMLTEIYRHQGAWRVAAVEQGFNGGMAALVQYFGGEVAGDASPGAAAPVPSPAPAAPSASKIDLRKQQVATVLKNAGIEHVKARVMVVMDASGSMRPLYARGSVQDTLERLIPVALRLDDNNSMEFWFYADSFAQVGDLDEDSVHGVVGNEMPQKRGVTPAVRNIGGGNNEPPVMHDVLRVHRAASREDQQAGEAVMPTLVLFITDGGIGSASKKIEKIIKESAHEALFWQFLGLGKSNYGILAHLDTLQGRVIDNSGFFTVDNIDSVPDEQLYNQLLSEFAEWWKKWQTLPAAARQPAPPAPSAQRKVVLKKNASVDIRKAAQITITLSWTGQGDLDLYALYVLKDGTVGKVYYRDKGSAHTAPYITLSGDSRKAGKETATIHQPDRLAHVVFAAYSAVENGIGSFASYQPITTFTDDLGQEVSTPVRGRNHFSFWVALSAIDLTGEKARISHVERYSSFGTERSPLLHPSGRLEMNKGPVEFKTR